MSDPILMPIKPLLAKPSPVLPQAKVPAQETQAPSLFETNSAETSSYVDLQNDEIDAAENAESIDPNIIAYQRALIEFLTAKYIQEETGDRSQNLAALEKSLSEAARNAGLTDEEHHKIESACARTLREGITASEQEDLKKSFHTLREESAKTAGRFEELRSLHETYEANLNEIAQIHFSRQSIDSMRVQLAELKSKLDTILDNIKLQIAQNPEFADLAIEQGFQALFAAHSKLQTLGDLLHENSSEGFRREIATERMKILEKSEAFLAYAQTCLNTQIALAEDNADRDRFQTLIAATNEILPQARMEIAKRIPISLDPIKAQQAYLRIGTILREGVDFQDALHVQYRAKEESVPLFYGKLSLQRSLNKLNDSLPTFLQNDPCAKPFHEARSWFFDRENGALAQARAVFSEGNDSDLDAQNTLTEICLLEQIAATHPEDEIELRKELVSLSQAGINLLYLGPIDDSGMSDPDAVTAKLEYQRHGISNRLALAPLLEESEAAEMIVQQAASQAREMATYARQNHRLDYFSLAQIQLSKEVENARLTLSLEKTDLFEDLLRANNRDNAFTRALSGLFQRFPDAQFDFRPIAVCNLASSGYIAQFLVTVSNPYLPEFGKKEFILTGVSPVISRFSLLHREEMFPFGGLTATRRIPFILDRAPEKTAWHSRVQSFLEEDFTLPTLIPPRVLSLNNSTIACHAPQTPFNFESRDEYNPLFEVTPRLVEVTPETADLIPFSATGQNITLMDPLPSRDASTQLKYYGFKGIDSEDKTGKPFSFRHQFIDDRADPLLKDNPYSRDRYFANRLTINNGEIFAGLANAPLAFFPSNGIADPIALNPRVPALQIAPSAPIQAPIKNESPLEIEKLKGDLQIAIQHQQNDKAIAIAEKIIDTLDAKLRNEKDPSAQKELKENLSEAYRLKAGCEFAMGSYDRAESALGDSKALGSPVQKLQAQTFLAAVHVAQGGEAEEQAKILEQSINDLKQSLMEKSSDGKNRYSAAEKSAFYDAEMNAKVELIKLYTQAEMTKKAGNILDQIIQAAGDDPGLETLKLQALLEYGLALIDHDGRKALEILIPLSEKIHGEFASRTQYLYPLKEAISRCRADGRFDDTDGVIKIKDAEDFSAAFKQALHQAASSSLAQDIGFTVGGAAVGVAVGLCIASGPAAPIVAAGILIGIAVGTLFKWGTNVALGSDKIANAYHSGIDMVTSGQLTADCFSLGLDALDFVPLIGTAAKAETTLGKMLIKESSKEALERGAKTYPGGVLIRNLAQEAGKEVAETTVKRSWRNAFGVFARKSLTEAEKENSVRFIKRGFRSFLGTWERRIQVAFPGFQFSYDSYHAAEDWMDGKIGGEEFRRRLYESGAYAIRNAFVNRRSASLITRQFSESARLVFPPARWPAKLLLK